jgi:hypothetical protein
MADTAGKQYSAAQLEKYLAFVQGAAREAMREMAPEYHMDPSALEMHWDNALSVDMWTYDYNESTKLGVLTFGMPAVDKNFKYTLRHALDVISKGGSRHVTNLSSVQTTPARNARVSAHYESVREGKKTLKTGEYAIHTFTSVMAVHKKTGIATMVSAEGLAAFDLQTEAYVELCKKVLGE